MFRPPCQRTAGSKAGTRAGTPRKRLATSSAMTTLPLASRAASACPNLARVWANAAASSAPLSRARWRRPARALLTALESHPAASGGRWERHAETSSTATASRVTASRTATPAQTHSSKPSHQCSGPLISTGPGASSAVPIPFVPVAHSDQHDHGAMLLSRARWSVSLSPWTVRMRPAPSVTVMTPPRLSTSLAIDAAAVPSCVNTISWSSVCSPEDSSSADAGGALLRLGSTWYCSRHRYQDVATSGRTPRTRSSPARNRSRAAVTAWYRSASLMPLRFAVWPISGMEIYLPTADCRAEGSRRPVGPVRASPSSAQAQRVGPPAVGRRVQHGPVLRDPDPIARPPRHPAAGLLPRGRARGKPQHPEVGGRVEVPGAPVASDPGHGLVADVVGAVGEGRGVAVRVEPRLDHVLRRPRRVRAVARVRDPRVVGVAGIDDDPRDEAARSRRRVDAVEVDVRRVGGIRLLVTHRRPTRVAAHSVPASLGV